MAVICFGSLKGGVGKTSMSVNVAHAFAARGCETLIIDLDPMAHASRFFRLQAPAGVRSSTRVGVEAVITESPLARLFLASDFAASQADEQSPGAQNSTEAPEAVVECAIAAQIPLIRPVRDNLAILPSGPELRHFLWGRGARAFGSLFPRLIAALECSYDYIVIDTPPDFNILTRNAIAAANLAVVPVDSSAMSIHCLEEIVANSSHIEGPTWLIARTMLSKQATRVQRLSTARLHEKLALSRAEAGDMEDEDTESSSDPYVSLLSDSNHNVAQSDSTKGSDQGAAPIYLLNSIVYRREQQNRMTFLGRTAFDGAEDPILREAYMTLARELEQMLAISTRSSEPDMPTADFSVLSSLNFQ